MLCVMVGVVWLWWREVFVVVWAGVGECSVVVVIVWVVGMVCGRGG